MVEREDDESEAGWRRRRFLKKEELVGPEVTVKKVDDDGGSIEAVLKEGEGGALEDSDNLLELLLLGWIESVDFLDRHMRGREREIPNGRKQDLPSPELRERNFVFRVGLKNPRILDARWGHQKRNPRQQRGEIEIE